MEISLLIVAVVLAAVAAALTAIGLLRKPPKPDLSEMERRFFEELRQSRQEISATINSSVHNAAQTQADTQRQLTAQQTALMRELREQLTASQQALQKGVTDQLAALDSRFASFAKQNEQQLEHIRNTLVQRVTAMQEGNEKKLEEMRRTVDEKLQKTLDERLKQSFSLVNENLDRVQRGLGEMQTLATGVGDLKKVLTNVKTKGILGEIQLGAILEEILAPEQYATNVETVPGSGCRVEYAVRLPGDGEGESVWLPIDAKFPSEAYAALLDAQESADAEGAVAAGKQLEARVRQFAKDIRDKYVQVPHTTEFGIMFLPMEGLYAEVVRRGLVEKLQSDFKINIAGPTTTAALLNSLQMGFRTLAIQRRSGEVWKVLGEVKTEFGKFADHLQKTKYHLKQASDDIDTLIGTRTNQMQRKLRGVTNLADNSAEPQALPTGDEPE